MQLIPIDSFTLWAIPNAIAHIGDTLPDQFRAIAHAAGPIVVTAMWQGAAVALGLSICLRLAPRISASHRFGLWMAGFSALVCLPILPLLSRLMAGAAPPLSSGFSQAATRPWLQFDARWSMAIAAIWAAASLFRAVDLAVHSFRLRMLWKAAIPVDLGATLVAPLPRAGRRGPVQICTTDNLDRPSVIGFLAPRILIPTWLLGRLTPGELNQIVLHEAEHLRRGDHWTNLFQKLCLVLFPLNPAMWWIERRLCKEREMACDDGVVRATSAPRAYAACLASIAERGLERRAEALSLGAWQRRPELVHRVHSILLRKHELNPLATRAVLATLGCALVVGSVELARCPQLIAFVPSRTAKSSQTFAAAHAPTMPAHLLNAAFVPVRQSGRIRLTGEPRETRLKADLPADHEPASMATQASLERAGTSSTSNAEAMSSEVASAIVPRRRLAKELADPRTGLPPVREWIVFTAWEQVQTTAPAAQQESTKDAGQSSGPAADENGSQSNVQQINRITVTRLIFRVVPAGSKSSQSIPLPVREGWLVIQL
ncbi:MAG: M56 family metallopeptidase [Terracidiphilus sp.]